MVTATSASVPEQRHTSSREEPLSMDDSAAVALLQLLNGACERSQSPASSCGTGANADLDTPRTSDSDRSISSPSPAGRRRGMRERKPSARFDGTEDPSAATIDSPPSVSRRPSKVRRLSAPRQDHHALSPEQTSVPNPAVPHERNPSGARSGAPKQPTPHKQQSAPAPTSNRSSGGNYNKYCHFCQHVKVKHTTSMFACANMDCQRRYCEYCLRIHLEESSAGSAGGAGWECPHCRKSCCCTHAKCKAQHRHCKAYRYRLLRASQAGVRMAARAQGKGSTARQAPGAKTTASDTDAAPLASTQAARPGPEHPVPVDAARPGIKLRPVAVPGEGGSGGVKAEESLGSLQRLADLKVHLGGAGCGARSLLAMEGGGGVQLRGGSRGEAAGTEAELEGGRKVSVAALVHNEDDQPLRLG